MQRLFVEDHDLNQIRQKALPDSKCLRILFVEDDDDMTMLLFFQLMELQIKKEITFVKDPYEAVNNLVENHYDLVFMDWNILGVTGYQAILKAEKSILSDPEKATVKKEIPIVVVSGSRVEECNFQNSRFFKFIGHINKRQSLKDFFTNIFDYINPSFKKMLFNQA